MTTLTRHKTYHLASLADTASPDHPLVDNAQAFPPSPGAIFLHRVEDATAEAIVNAEGEDVNDLVHEVADSCVPIYTHELWQTFVDLAAYNEDVGTEYGDLTSLASLALYGVACRLVEALVAEWIDEKEA